MKYGSGVLADGSTIPFNGEAMVELRLRHRPLRIRCVVSPVQEDVILGMPFLQEGCTIDVKEMAVVTGTYRLAGTDRFGKDMTANVQVSRTVTITAQCERVFLCRALGS